MNIVLLAIIGLLGWAIATSVFGIVGGTGLLAFVLLVLAVAKGFFKLPVLPTNAKISQILSVVLAVFLFGGAVGLNLPGSLQATGATVPGQPITVSTSPTSCSSSIPTELQDDTATVTVRPVDFQAGSEVVQTASIAVINSDTGDKYADITNAVSTSTVTVPLGTRIDIYAANNTALYGSALKGYCVKDRTPVINIEVASVQTEANLDVVDYDDDCVTGLTAGDVNDGKVTVSANEDKTLCFRIRNAGADAAYDLAGYGTIWGKNMTNFEPKSAETGTSVSFTKIGTPLYLQGLAIQMNNSAAPTLTKDYTTWKMSPIIRLKEFESVKHKFLAEVSSSNTIDTWAECATANSLATSECPFVAFTVLDANWQEGKDGQMYYDLYIHTDAEGNPGLAETVTSPEGGDNGVMIEMD